jgi:hypothetical protein
MENSPPDPTPRKLPPWIRRYVRIRYRTRAILKIIPPVIVLAAVILTGFVVTGFYRSLGSEWVGSGGYILGILLCAGLGLAGTDAIHSSLAKLPFFRRRPETVATMGIAIHLAAGLGFLLLMVTLIRRWI